MIGTGFAAPLLAALVLQETAGNRALSGILANASSSHIQENTMETLAFTALPMAAAGYSLVYLLAGGGVGGAIIIFIVAKMLGK